MVFPASIYYLFIIIILLKLVKAQVRVLQPPSLARQFAPGYIKGSTAAFGTPYWGEQLIGKLAYGESKGNAYCNATDYDLPPNSPTTTDITDSSSEFDGFPRIVLVRSYLKIYEQVRRGICHFVTKIRVAQDYKEAAAVIVVDEINSTRKGSDIRAVIMADDGWGRKVRIPSILISDEDGSLLINTISTGQEVIVELVWDVPNENVVHVDNWLSPAISSSINFLTQFAPYARILEHKIDFMPHYWIFSLPVNYNSMCLEPTTLDLESSIIVERFCGMVPDWGRSNITGQDIVAESSRQACLWQTTKTVDSSIPNSGNYSPDWWYYIERLNERCLRPSKPINTGSSLTAECSYKLMKDLNIPIEKIKACVEEFGESFLIADLYNHAWSPTAMMINNARFSGPLDPFIVTRAICTGFSNEPDVCTRLKSRHIHDYVFNPERASDIGWLFGSNNGNGNSGVPWWVYVLSIGSCFTISGIAICAYRNWLVKGLRNQLRYEVFEEVKTQISGIRPIECMSQAELTRVPTSSTYNMQI